MSLENKHSEKDFIITQLEKIKLVPVVKLNKHTDSIPLANALCEGGLPVAEVTFRTDAAYESIKAMKKNFPNMIVGAGTVVNVEQAKQALDAGSSFIVSPGLNSKVVEFALDNDILVLPGVCTPTEIIEALNYNLEIVKFFPAIQYGGLNTIKALSAPFPTIRFMPTGGININNILDYLSFPKVIACGGSWMVKDSLINEGCFEEIKTLSREASSLIS